MGIRLKCNPRKLRLCTSESNSKGYDYGGSKVEPDIKWNKGNKLNE
jgi:hypothetical protein